MLKYVELALEEKLLEQKCAALFASDAWFCVRRTFQGRI
jgi:hypothetical protein